jgi:pimeloyl-ACP methyl ester carboxylesterase
MIEGAGHWPHLEKPDAVSAKLLPFLREQVGAVVAV